MIETGAPSPADPAPSAEASRLAALDSYAILDTPAEIGFDDITRIASLICGTPIAMISLVDGTRQWFKSSVGVDAAETPRDIAFCAHAIEQQDVFEIGDATLDSRFLANPLVTGDPGLRFYAGAPLTTADGMTLGTLCVLDREPRKLTADQSSALQALARQVMAQLELRRALIRQREDERQRQLLIEELRHRIRNTLAVVQGIVSQSLRRATSPQQARETIDQRLTAMADAHDLLTRTDWSATSVGQVVEVANRALSALPGRVTAEGPEIALSPRAALALAMALHELSTNAAKYGALSTDDGSVAVRWTGGAPDSPVELVWQESGGPPVVAPTRRGFGTQLITHILPSTLGGTGTIDYDPDGVRWQLRTTLKAVS